MKIVKLHYFDTFEIIQGHRRFTKVGFEAEIDDEFEDVRDCFYKLKRKSEELFYESKAATDKQNEAQEKVTTTQNKNPVSKEQAMIQQINEITDLKVLETFSMLAKNYPKIKEAYDKKHILLTTNKDVTP